MVDQQKQGQQGGKPLTEVHAILRRIASTGQGYAFAVDLASTVEITTWHAEVVLPQGATAGAGPATTVEKQGTGVIKLVPANPAVPSPGVAGGKSTARVNAAALGSTQAPTHVRVQATLADGTAGSATVDGLYVTGKNGRVYPASEQSWPGSSKTQTDPTKFTTGSGGGFGGGGGGGGQFSCDLLVDFANQTVKHVIGSDAGGGGGSGGGYGGGTEYQQNNHQQH